MGNFVFYKNISDYSNLPEVLELVGFNTATMDHNIKQTIDKLSIIPRDFIVRALPDSSVEGTTRECFIEIQNFEIELLENRAILEFELGKGSYATIVVKMMFGG